MTANSLAFAVVCLGCAVARVDSVIKVDKDNLAAQDLPSICTGLECRQSWSTVTVACARLALAFARSPSTSFDSA